jgi:signal transduction histidine kinase/CheY-like chemotaxis protein
MIRKIGEFADPAWESRFLRDVHDRMFWVVLGPWLAGSLIVLVSIYQAYLRIGPSPELLLVGSVRLALVAAVVAACYSARGGFDHRSYRIAAAAVLLGLVLFNVTAVLSGSSDWDRIARATIIELFLIGLSLMIFPREALVGLACIWLAHMALGFLGFAQSRADLFNNLLLITLAAIVSAVIVWRFSLSERRAFVDRCELTEARREADRSNQAKTRFLANMSHEIRTPMTGMLGMLDVALDEPLPDAQRARIAAARSSAWSLLAILNDVLDSSKIEAEGVSLEEAPFDPAQLLREVQTIFASRAADKGLTFHTELDGLPPALHGDAARLRQVIVNLVGNAVKFTTAGSVRLFASFRAAAGNAGRLRVEVTDDGIGIPRLAQSSLFQRFSQADASTTRRFGGTGLGLSISREIIEAMDGRIGLRSLEGVGSTFWLEIPSRLATAALQAPPQVAEAAAATRGLKLLVAEDNVINQKIIDAYLRKAGHEPVMVANGREALEAAQREAFDLILMDMQMPVLDGLGATRALRALDGPAAEVPIVALTAETMEGDRERLLAAGLDDYVAKPIDRDELFRSIARAAGSPRS